MVRGTLEEYWKVIGGIGSKGRRAGRNEDWESGGGARYIWKVLGDLRDTYIFFNKTFAGPGDGDEDSS